MKQLLSYNYHRTTSKCAKSTELLASIIDDAWLLAIVLTIINWASHL